MSTSAFFSSDDAITRKILCQQTITLNEEIEIAYDVKYCIQWILENEFLSVALQFPDSLLVDAPKVAKHIQGKVPNSTVFILGDTSYGSCCVDEVGAQHYEADCVIHYGSACLSSTMRLPVFYVFGRSQLDVNDCVSKLRQVCSDPVLKTVLVYDTKYAFIIDQVHRELQKYLPNLILSTLLVPNSKCGSQIPIYSSIYPNVIHFINETETSQTSSTTRCGRVISLPGKDDDIDDYTFMFIGNPDGSTLVNMIMNFNKSPFVAYDPETTSSQRITLNVNKALMKRYYLIERAKDAKIIGILAGTLGVAKYKEVIEHLKTLIKKAGKKSYTFVVGKLNPPKLANFAEVEVYVLVSCPESCLFDQADFHCPVVTPFEMEIACNKAREWTGNYTTDFSSLLPGASLYIQVPEAGSDEDEVDISLITNRVRVLGETKNVEPASVSKDVVVRSDAWAVATTAENASEFLSNRSWQGLEQNLGKTPVVKAAEGQTGIAAGYENEQDPL